MGGQTQSPYIEGGVDPSGKWLGHTVRLDLHPAFITKLTLLKTPAGSSSGSAVSVAAGFSPWSIGTESDGSIIQPALRAAVYGLKPTVGATDLKGAEAEQSRLSSLGGFAKTTKDLADLTSTIMSGPSFDSFLKGSWKGIRIAYLDPIKWHYPESVSEVNDDFDKQSVCEIIPSFATSLASNIRLSELERSDTGGTSKGRKPGCHCFI